jgi:nitroimidazol reductase NimA-like FMN-containing flavoprotein (pyridoxamine 5'-phosphate oxidase superfamily)
LRRLPQRGVYDRETIYGILDEALICHVGFLDDGHPMVLPMIHVRIEDCLYLHGAIHSRLIRRVAEKAQICVTVTLLDGLVLARSAFHHSMNYRSVVAMGTAGEVTDPMEKRKVLHALVEHVVPGRSKDARGPSLKELNATGVVCLPLTECSAKIRSGPPFDEEEDRGLNVWAGVLPLSLQCGLPQPDGYVTDATIAPSYVRSYRRPSHDH